LNKGVLLWTSKVKVFLGEEVDELMENTLKELDEWFILSREINRLANEMRNCIHVNVKQTKEIIILMFMTKVSNHFQSIILLLQKGLSVGSDILARSMLESVIPMKLLVVEDGFFDDYIRNSSANKLSLYNVVLDKHNKEIFGVSNEDSIARDKLKSELEPQFEDGKIRTFKIEELARRAEMNLDYQLAYRYLSGYAHSNLDILEKSYLIVSDDGQIAFNYGHITEPYRRILFSSMYFLLIAVEHLNQQFDVKREKEIEEYVNRFSREINYNHFEKNINLKFFIGLLNSTLLSKFYKIYFNSLSLAGGFFRIGAPQIKLNLR
jgi:hypothetical protein